MVSGNAVLDQISHGPLVLKYSVAQSLPRSHLVNLKSALVRIARSLTMKNEWPGHWTKAKKTLHKQELMELGKSMFLTFFMKVPLFKMESFFTVLVM